MFILWLDGSRLTEEDFHALAHDGFAVEDLPDSDCGGFVEEGDYDAPEGFYWGP